MHFIIINCSAHNKNQSNTAMLLEHFQRGIVIGGSTYEGYCLSQKGQWHNIEKAVRENENIIFALPVYAATIPGIMKEFLEKLSNADEKIRGKRMAFILQSGFPEACQRVYCENYLKVLPSLFESEFNGILSYGINSRFIDNTGLNDMQDSFCKMGELFVQCNGSFFFQQAVEFNGSYYITEKEAKSFNRIFTFFCKHISEEIGCKEPLTAKPYATDR